MQAPLSQDGTPMPTLAERSTHQGTENIETVTTDTLAARQGPEMQTAKRN